MVSDQQHAPAALYSRERPGTHFTGGWVGPRDSLDGRKISSPPGFDPGRVKYYMGIYHTSEIVCVCGCVEIDRTE